jgi:hypothetical protein
MKHSEIEKVSEKVKEHMRIELSNNSWAIRLTSLGILATTLISIAGGSIFWHFVLRNVGNNAIEWLVGTAFSSIISMALIWSEIASDSNRRIIDDANKTDNLIELASSAEAEEKAQLALHRQKSKLLQADLRDDDTLAFTARQEIDNILAHVVKDETGAFIEKLQEHRASLQEKERIALLQLKGGNTSGIRSHQTIPVSSSGKLSSITKEHNVRELQKLLDAKGVKWVKTHLDDIANDMQVGKSTLYRYLDELDKSPA